MIDQRAHQDAPLLAIQNLVVELHGSPPVPLVDGVTLSLARGQRLGVVGESGSGKTLTALAVMRVLPPGIQVRSGSIHFNGQNLLELDEPTMQRLRGDRLAMAVQDPLTALDPLMRVGDQVVEPQRVHGQLSPGAARERAVELLRLMQVPRPSQTARNYPHQLSGGMRQRAVLAASLACSPELLIADEPTTALDVTTQAQVLRLLWSIVQARQTALLLVTHDLDIVRSLCDHMAVMYAGRIVETGPTAEVLERPRHPYTRGLLGSAPRLGDRRPRLTSIPGQPPDPTHRPAGCWFAPRCAYARPICLADYPPLTGPSPTHGASCWLQDEVAAGV